MRYPRAATQGRKFKTLLVDLPAGRRHGAGAAAAQPGARLRAGGRGRPGGAAGRGPGHSGQCDSGRGLAHRQPRARRLAERHRVWVRRRSRCWRPRKRRRSTCDALREQMAVAQADPQWPGLRRERTSRLHARRWPGRSGPGAAVARRASASSARRRSPGAFAVAPDKRATLELALDHLVEQAPQQPGGDRVAGGRLAVRHHRGRQGQVHAVPELRQCLPGQRAAGQPAAAPAALHREELRAVRPVRQHLPRKGDRAEAAPAAHAASARRRGCSTKPSPMPACAAASRSER